VFLLYGDPVAGTASGAASRLTAEVAERREPVIDTVTSDGIRHRLWAVTDPGEQAEIVDDLRPRQALIADGHHRYATYLRLQTERHAAGLGRGPWDYGLALLVDQVAYPPRLQAIHRVVRDLDWREALERSRTAFRTSSLVARADEQGGLEKALLALGKAGREGPAFLLTGGEEIYLLAEPDQRSTEPIEQHSTMWAHLDASIAHGFVLETVWDVDDVDTFVDVRHRAEDAVALARHTRGTALLLNPTPLEAVFTLARNGEHMPRKSTSFGPKPLTGLVIRSLER
jgi:uncharacterized protein (DUF1015 family)